MMTGLLFGTLPETVCCGGVEYAIATDFKIWIQVEMLLFETEGEFYTKLPKLLKLCYPVLPQSAEEAIRGIISFYGGRESGAECITERRNFKRIYGFRQDASLIYAGFYQHGIDLTLASMHWFQFKALFCGLSENTQFSKVAGYRSVDLSGFKNEEIRRFYHIMQDMYRLKDYRTEEERERDISDALAGLF